MSRCVHVHSRWSSGAASAHSAQLLHFRANSAQRIKGIGNLQVTSPTYVCMFFPVNVCVQLQMYVRMYVCACVSAR